MTGLIGSLGNVVGGNAANTDRKQQLAGFGDLSNIFNFSTNTGKTQSGAASDLLGQAGGYYSKLLGGDRAATLSAVAPTVNAATQQTDAAKRQIAGSGTARGGGVNATTQTLDDSKRANIDSAVNSAKSGAAAGAAQVGGTVASQASNLLGLGGSVAGDLSKLAGDSRTTSDAMHRQKVSDVGSLTNSALDVIFG